MYLHIHVSLDSHTVEPLLTHTPQWSSGQSELWFMKGLWANRGMVKKQILKVRKKMQKIIKEM